MIKELQPVEQPTFYFIGVTTGKSSIMKVFPEWAKHLKLGAVMKGIDCVPHDKPERYRTIVQFVKEDPLSLGALVTTHKIDLLKASGDLFDGLDRYAELLGEVSSISKKGDQLWGHAKDPITGGLSLTSFIPAEHWKETKAEACILGAGGSSLALTTHIIEKMKPPHRPAKIVVTNRSKDRLEEMKKVHQKMQSDFPIEYHHCPDPRNNDLIVEALSRGSLVANATGLGKDAPGSPLTDKAQFPETGFAWDFNYRGDLHFLEQAKAQQKAKELTIEDGWVYFIHGWTSVMAEVFHRELPTSGPGFDELSRIAAEAR